MASDPTSRHIAEGKTLSFVNRVRSLSKRTVVAIFGAALLLAVIVIGAASGGPSPATPAPQPAAVKQAWQDGWTTGYKRGVAVGRGDDNRDGKIQEDESGWNCHTMGNRHCGR